MEFSETTNSALQRRRKRRRRPRGPALGWPPLALLLALLALEGLAKTAGAQFLFTYEINAESDDSRAPKSSLFDPAAFKIVTPAQLQSSYQKLSGQPPEQAPSTPPVAALGSGEPGPEQSASPPPPPPPSSFLKQTSAALQSFAELFSLAPNSSPAPLGSALPAPSGPSQPAVAAGQPPLQQPQQVAPPGPQLDHQAEARSLHEHWTQQQQKAHQTNQLQLEHPAPLQQAPAPISALQSFTTSPTVSASQRPPPGHQAQPSQASYWLTANPLNAPDGNYLVEIKQPAQQQQQQQQPPVGTGPHASLVDSLLALGQPANQPPRPAQPAQLPVSPSSTPAGLEQLQPTPTVILGRPRHAAFAPAQNSFLATPTSYYPNPSAEAPTMRPLTMSQPAHQHQARSLLRQAPPPRPHQPVDGLRADLSLPPAPQQVDQLQPPANAPEHYQQQVAVPQLARPLKSAEESLNSFRQQQQRQHDQQSALLASQQQLANQQRAHEQQSGRFGLGEPSGPNGLGELGEPTRSGVALGAAEESLNSIRPLEPQLNQQAAARLAHSAGLGEIPKVSPQIYESFLLQQRDQHEKHMELLKQQQELNKLLEQKQRQQEAEQAKRKRKKEELERQEAQRKKAAAARAEQEERKLRLEAEEARRKQLRQEEEAAAAARRKKAAEEERRYRELLAEKEAEEEQQRRRLKAEQEAAAVAAEEKRRQQAVAEEAAKYRNYLRQQEELKKLLELKQREDEAIQARRRQVQQQQAAGSSSPAPSGGQRANLASRANKLAQEHKERSRASSWGAPIRSVRLPADSQQLDPPTTASTTTSTMAPSQSSARPRTGPHSTRRPKQAADERLIRQKIPLYSGAGKYGLYRTGNESLDLAALLESVTLPSSTTTTSSSTTTTEAPDMSTLSHSDTSSLSPLLDRSSLAPVGDLFDSDDVPRRPARTLTAQPLRASFRSGGSARGRPEPAGGAVNSTSSPAGSRTAHIGLASLPADADNDGIPGRAGVEYPVLAAVPPTSFSCAKQPLNGYYADTETACQVVHLCQGGVQSSILCPNGTIFNQEKFSCQWWYEVNCSKAPIFYQLNDNLYKALPGAASAADKAPERRSRASSSSSAPRSNLL